MVVSALDDSADWDKSNYGKLAVISKSMVNYPSSLPNHRLVDLFSGADTAFTAQDGTRRYQIRILMSGRV
jgi:hypothetical protein